MTLRVAKTTRKPIHRTRRLELEGVEEAANFEKPQQRGEGGKEREKREESAVSEGRGVGWHVVLDEATDRTPADVKELRASWSEDARANP